MFFDRDDNPDKINLTRQKLTNIYISYITKTIVRINDE